MKLIIKITQIFLAATILLSSMIFQPINSYAIEEEELLVLIDEKVGFLEGYHSGAPLDYNYDYKIQLGDPERNWPYILVGAGNISYEDVKKQFLENTTPIGFMLSVPNFILNVNGKPYMKYREDGGFGEGGFQINHVKIVDQDEDTIYTHCRSFFPDGSLFQEYYISLQKVNDSWNISWISGCFGVRPLATTEKMESVFANYIEQTIFSYLFSQNINCGYEKFSQEADDRGRISMDIVVDSFDSESCTGKGHAILDEYDENGNIISQHKIVVEIGENLSEKVTDYDLSKDNPDTADSSIIFYAISATISFPLICLLKQKRLKASR